jgi:hypothetical protein
MNLQPGNYKIKQVQPLGMRDGTDKFEAPVQRSGNDEGTVAIAQPGGVRSLHNTFAERGLMEQYGSTFGFLSSDGDPDTATGILFGLDGTASWHSFVNSTWDGYESAALTMSNVDGEIAKLTVVEVTKDAAGRVTNRTTKEHTFREGTLDAFRLLFSGDGNVARVIGQPSNLDWTEVVGEGEGPASEDLAAGAREYQRGADAVFAEVGEAHRAVV